ncbi:MAG TPA: glycosyltransferase [Pyrinomonadaceae bacterium]
MKYLSKIKEKSAKISRIGKDEGWSGIKLYLKGLRSERRQKKDYQKWIKAHEITRRARRQMHLEIESFSLRPKISVVMPVYNVGEKWLRLCIESVLGQIYENWEFCIADDASPSPHVRKILEEYAARDERIKTIFRRENGHISAASNSALELATGEFTALLDHDDELSEDALFRVAKEINDFPDARMIYSDEDLIDERGRRFGPKFKPDWSLDLFYSLNLITHLSIYRTEILRRVEGFRIGAEGSQDYDLAMRVVEQISENQIRHIPRVLYHWRAIQGSVAFSMEEKPYAHERARDALRAHFERTGKKATVSRAIINLHRVRYDLPENLPKVSLILEASEDFGFTEKAIENFVAQTDYANFEIVLVLRTGAAKNSEQELAPTFSKFSASALKIIVCDKQSEAAKLNFAAAQSDGEILCFVDLNLKPLAKDWLTELASFAFQKEIGAVGAKLLYKNGSVLHGGLIIGANDTVGVAHQNLPRASGGNFLRARLINNFSAVSVSCLAVRREVFREFGGFDAENLPDKFFDADFCLRLREKNYRIVFTPYAELIKASEKMPVSAEKAPTDAERKYFSRRWQKLVERDPFYNPNLSKKDASFSIDV